MNLQRSGAALHRVLDHHRFKSAHKAREQIDHGNAYRNRGQGNGAAAVVAKDIARR
jgi:hypothetical protein